MQGAVPRGPRGKAALGRGASSRTAFLRLARCRSPEGVVTLWQVSGHLKDESHMLPHSNSRTLPRLGVAFGAALTLLAATGDPARAAGSTLVGEGLHIASGALVDPHGRTWVAD